MAAAEADPVALGLTSCPPPPLRPSMLPKARGLGLLLLLPGEVREVGPRVLLVVAAAAMVGEVRRELLLLLAMAFCGGGERLKRILGCASSARVKQKSYIAYFGAVV